MPNPIIDKLILTHQQSLDLCRLLVADGLAERHVPSESIEAIKDAEGCEFSRILKSGMIQFDGSIGEETVHVLHDTFHAVASLILTLATSRTKNSEIGSYIAALNSISDQLITALKAAHIRH